MARGLWRRPPPSLAVHTPIAERKLLFHLPITEPLSKYELMLFRRTRRRRWIALIALLGLLFQQLAMAAYICPLESPGATGTTVATTSDAPPCHSGAPTDKARCHQHCHPLPSSPDHASVPPVPAALVPATTWLRDAVHHGNSGYCETSSEILARATSPPLNIQHCTFQI